MVVCFWKAILANKAEVFSPKFELKFKPNESGRDKVDSNRETAVVPTTERGGNVHRWVCFYKAITDFKEHFYTSVEEEWCYIRDYKYLLSMRINSQFV